jgi:flotillin
MEKKAEAWRQYNEAAVLQILAPLLPEIARAIAEPLTKIDRITMVNTGGNGEIGVSRVTGEVAKVIAQVPPVLESLTGLKLEQLMERLKAKETTAAPELPSPRVAPSKAPKTES